MVVMAVVTMTITLHGVLTLGTIVVVMDVRWLAELAEVAHALLSVSEGAVGLNARTVGCLELGGCAGAINIHRRASRFSCSNPGAAA